MLRTFAGAALLLACGGSQAADAARGAQLYLRTDADTRSCVSCHGPDPGTNHNNILRAADNPDTLTKVLNTVSQMGFLRSQLSDPDRADIAAFLGTINRLNAADGALRMWPVTLDFGQVPVGSSGAAQSIRLRNASTQALALGSIASSSPQVLLQHNCPESLAPAAFCDVQVRPRPSGPGLLRAAVSVSSAASTTPLHAGVSAAGTGAAASMLGWMGDPPGLRFQPTNAAAASRQTLVLTNPGPMPAVLGLTSIVGPDTARFQIERTTCLQGAVVVAGTGCEITLVYTPSLSPTAQAVLQLRSDQGNPGSVRLEGEAAPANAQPEGPELLPVADSGGGCSTRPPGPKDPVLPLALLAAAWALFGKRRRGAGRPVSGDLR